jgi:hypothetical protein
MRRARLFSGRVWRRTAGRFERGPASKAVVRLGVATLAVLLLLGAASAFLDEPMRRAMERQVNQRLIGYSVRIPELDFRLFGLSLTLRDVVIRQDSNPEPPVAAIRSLHASVQWKALLSLRLVADFLFDRPSLYVNLTQLRSEARSPTSLKNRGWQEAALAIFPLKINLLEIRRGSLTYIDEDPQHPLVLSEMNLRANDIRNIRSKPQAYPSPVQGHAVVFETGRATIAGHADFLSAPHAGFHVRFSLRDVPLDRLRPVASRANVRLKGGILSVAGGLEYAPEVKSVHLTDVTARGIRFDYVRTRPKREDAPGSQGHIRLASRRRTDHDLVALRIDRMNLLDADIGMVNPEADPSYRVYLDRANLSLTHFGGARAPGRATLTGRFMGSGRTEASMALQPDRGEAGPSFDLKVSIEETDMKRMNPLLRAHGNFDVSTGFFSVFSEIHVRDGNIRGYVKPLFRDMEVYDRRQEQGKGVFKKVYERLVDIVTDLFENRERDEVATVAQLRGRISKPDSSTLQILGGLIENALFDAILPGFEREISRSRPRQRS